MAALSERRAGLCVREGRACFQSPAFRMARLCSAVPLRPAFGCALSRVDCVLSVCFLLYCFLCIYSHVSVPEKHQRVYAHVKFCCIFQLYGAVVVEGGCVGQRRLVGAVLGEGGGVGQRRRIGAVLGGGCGVGQRRLVGAECGGGGGWSAVGRVGESFRGERSVSAVGTSGHVTPT